jgi:hypothetical protein
MLQASGMRVTCRKSAATAKGELQKKPSEARPELSAYRSPSVVRVRSMRALVTGGGRGFGAGVGRSRATAGTSSSARAAASTVRRRDAELTQRWTRGFVRGANK